MLIEAHRSILLIVDFQERLMPAIHAGCRCCRTGRDPDPLRRRPRTSRSR